MEMEKKGGRRGNKLRGTKNKIFLFRFVFLRDVN